MKSNLKVLTSLIVLSFASLVSSNFMQSSLALSPMAKDCESQETTNYLTASCTNTLFSGGGLNGTATVSDLSCGTFGGWFVDCVFVVHNNNHTTVYSASSQTGGQRYNPAINLTNAAQDARNPSVGLFGDTVYVQYEAKDGVYNLFLTNSTNGGESFGNAIKLSNSTTGVHQSLLIVDNTGKTVSTWVNGDTVKTRCSHC